MELQLLSLNEINREFTAEDYEMLQQLDNIESINFRNPMQEANFLLISQLPTYEFKKKEIVSESGN